MQNEMKMKKRRKNGRTVNYRAIIVCELRMTHCHIAHFFRHFTPTREFSWCGSGDDDDDGITRNYTSELTKLFNW